MKEDIKDMGGKNGILGRVLYASDTDGWTENKLVLMIKSEI